MRNVITDSPVEVARKAGPCGNADWPGYGSVYTEIARAAEKMGASHYAHGSFDHIETMADLGSGHESRMKARLWWLRDHGWIPWRTNEKPTIVI